MAIIDDILSLSEDSQWEIISSVLDNLTEPSTDDDIYDKRLADLKSGKVEGVPHKKMMETLRNKIST